MVNDQVLPFQLAVPALDLARLRARITDTRWPELQTVPDNSQGTPILKLRALCEYWQEHYDWRRCEDALNTLTHGWPGSVLEFSKVFRPLVDPVSHGGEASDAFHIIVPSLPGFGFSGKPQTPQRLHRFALKYELFSTNTARD
jgi:pimeloyl-ACP methyl ester carboxylesterase